MNGFLVLGTLSSDDVPIGLFEGFKEATNFADSLSEDKVLAALDFVLSRDAKPYHVLFISVHQIINGVVGPSVYLKDFGNA